MSEHLKVWVDVWRCIRRRPFNQFKGFANVFGQNAPSKPTEPQPDSLTDRFDGFDGALCLRVSSRRPSDFFKGMQTTASLKVLDGHSGAEGRSQSRGGVTQPKGDVLP
jgi:hypothetical protein